jgi:methylenetetrahydrofolate reductase (NADPH)
MVNRLISSKLVPGVHFCTLNLEKSVRTILESLDWVKAPTSEHSSPLLRHNKLIIEDEDDTSVPTANGSGLTIPAPMRRTSSVSGVSISPSEASQLAQWGLTNRALQPAPKKGLGTQGVGMGGLAEKNAKAEDSWDEYPNGRFTDIRSPAYGEIDGWGSGLKTNVSREIPPPELG